MTRDELEAVIWRHWPARGPEAGAAVDAILAAAEEYASEVQAHRTGGDPAAFWHTSGTDLHPVISVLAGALLGEDT